MSTNKLTAATLKGFVGSVLANRYDESVATPLFHEELWDLACSKHRYVAVAAPRGHAKSTAGTMAYGLAKVLFRESKYVVIVSDTEGQAVMFLQNIKAELLENEMIADLFGLAKDEKTNLVKFEKDTESDIIVAFADGNKFRIVAKGAEQRLRGMNWSNTRPDLILVDDLENDELCMNKERRYKLRRWFISALLPVLAPRGIVRMWGTILHMDSLLESLMPNESLKSCIETEDGLKVYDPKQRGQWVSVKYRAHNSDMSILLWPQRFSKKEFQKWKEEAFRLGMPDSYSQEYLNHPIDESVSYFKRRDFQSMKAEYKELNLHYYITADLAISQESSADYSAFVIAAMDENRRIHVVDVIRERLDGREIVDMILSLQNTFQPEAFGIEEMQVSKAIGPFLREEMQEKNIYPNIYLLKHGGKDKIQRGRSMQARMRARSVFFDQDNEWYPIFEDECLKFPRAKHDDQVDAFFYLGILLDKMTAAPTAEEQWEDEYEEEMRDTTEKIGRNSWSGY